MISEPRFERRAELLEAPLGDEIVALDADKGECFGFNPVAASVWRLLEKPCTVAEMETSLREEYDVDEVRCRAELAELLADLERRALIRRA